MFGPPRQPDVPTTTAEAVYQQLTDDAVTAKPLVIDVREPDEWVQGHIAEARHIPLNQLPAQADALPHDQEIVLVCHMGSRSAMATAWLLRHGFDRAINLTGGMDAWEGRQLPVVMGP